MKDPKFFVGDAVHIDGTSGVGKIIFIEVIGRKYIYTVQYPGGLKKNAQEQDLIKVS